MPAAAAPARRNGRVTPAEAILTLIARRAPGATICPSEAARLLAGPDGDWRGQMDAVHAAAETMVADGTIALSWKGAPVPSGPTQKRRGPYRIARR